MRKQHSKVTARMCKVELDPGSTEILCKAQNSEWEAWLVLPTQDLALTAFSKKQQQMCRG